MTARSNIRLQTWVLAAGVLLMAIKFVAWWLTHSTTILSDALESIVNVVAGAFALYSLYLAAKPRDREHPYGHGKVEFISAGIEGGLVVLAGAMIIWRAVEALLREQHLHDLGTGIGLTAAAGGLNLLMGLALQKRGKDAHSITMEASGTHLLSDAWSTVAMLVGLVVIQLTGLLWLDQVFAIAFAVFIIITGLRVFRRSVAGIMDEADLKLAADVIATLEQHRVPQWVDVHNFRMIGYGPVLHIDCHVTLPWYYSLEQAHAEISAIERLVNEVHEREVELFIHMDPCIPTSCAICALEGCRERKMPFQQRVKWDAASVLGNAKHGIAS
ncbi:MAG: cation transporter [Flavobacteriales bacterium]|nr:cation transporter [Flavobacteriales bacterium]